MPPEPSDRDHILLWDIVLAGEDALEFVAQLDEAAFRASKLHQNAVIRSLEVVGEAAGQLSTAFRDRHADIPWRRIVDMRNKLIHGYATVEVSLVWEALHRHLPPLLSALAQYRRE